MKNYRMCSPAGLTQNVNSDRQILICELVSQPVRTGKIYFSWLSMLCCIAIIDFGFQYPQHFLPLAIMFSTTILAVRVGLSTDQGGIPLMSAIALQQGIVFCLPLFIQNESTFIYDESLLLPCSLQYMVFLICIVAGWYLAFQITNSYPSRYYFFTNASKAVFEGKLRRLAIGALAFGLITQFLFFTGIFWLLPSALSARLYSIVSSASHNLIVVGGILGGYSCLKSAKGRLAFWSLWLGILILLISSVLLSSAGGLIFSTFVGMFLGSKRPPWTAMLFCVAIFAFLNQGKFAMREQIERDGKGASLTTLPSFFAQWIEFSSERFFGFGQSNTAYTRGQSMAERVNNLQSLVFVNDALLVRGMESLRGRGYLALPTVFVPRLIWPEKPRTHEGQVLLNLHYKRQASESDTFTTYIAWGFLAEAVGNFGIWIGPVVCGLFMGIACGVFEKWSRNKGIASVEGICALVIFAFSLASFEMTIGVFAAALFQTIVVIVGAGLVFRVRI